MQDDNEVSVEQLLVQLKRKGIPLPFEIGAFIALEVCEQIVRSPVRVRASDIWLGEIGEIMMGSSDERCSEKDAVRTTLALLSDLLVCSAPGVPPMLLELIEHGPSAGDWTLARLRDDLEACLLPLNRGATRRVLARLLREVQRQGDRSGARPSTAPDAASLDAELDDLLGIKPGELPPPKPPKLEPIDDAPESEDLVPDDDAPAAPRAQPAAIPFMPRSPATGTSEKFAPPPSTAAPQASEEPPTRAEARRAPAPAVATPIDLAAERGPRLRTEELFEEEGERRGLSGGVVIGGLFLFITGVLVVAYLTLGQIGARRLLGLDDKSQAATAPSPAKPASQKVGGELHVTSTPPRAQVFLFVGEGPTLATDLAIGVAQEFVALADGHEPARAIVPAGAKWDGSAPGQPRYELAMQAGKPAAAGADRELGATLMPREPGTPSGTLGSVRVITTPPGARVYQLIGFTPDVSVSGLPLDRGYEVLVYLPGYAPATRGLQAGDFQGEGAARVASVNVTLEKKKR